MSSEKTAASILVLISRSISSWQEHPKKMVKKYVGKFWGSMSVVDLWNQVLII